MSALWAFGLRPSALGLTLPINSEAGAWVAFALAAYISGHFLFLIASLLDEAIYDRFLRPRLDDNVAFLDALRLKNSFFGLKDAEENKELPMNAFAWAKSVMILRAPRALSDVQRYEADSKFFRSLMVVMPLLGIIFVSRFGYDTLRGAVLLVATVILMLLAGWRYAEQRFKSTQWAYRYMITLLGSSDEKVAAILLSEIDRGT